MIHLKKMFNCKNNPRCKADNLFLVVCRSPASMLTMEKWKKRVKEEVKKEKKENYYYY